MDERIIATINTIVKKRNGKATEFVFDSVEGCEKVKVNYKGKAKWCNAIRLMLSPDRVFAEF